jgi:alanyl aminopeptidase
MRRAWVASCALLCAGLSLSACPGPAEVHEPRTTSSTPAPRAPRVLPEATRVELPDDVAPRAVRLELTLDPRKEIFRGRAEIDVEVRVATDTVVLHARGLTLEKVSIEAGGRTLEPQWGGRGARSAAGRSPRSSSSCSTSRWPSDRRGCASNTRPPFANLNGIYRTQAQGSWFAFTQMEPTDARRAFPSFDEPRHKTPIELTLEIPSGMTAFANAAEKSREVRGDHTQITFLPSEPIPTYLFALAVGDLEVMTGATKPTPIRFVAPRGRAKKGGPTLDATDKALRALEAYFARPHPYPKLDIASVPNFGPGAMENAGLITFREELVVLDERSPALLRRRMQLIMAHELAHQWFGNLVTMRWWDDLWLNEGFATWMAPKTCDDAFPGFGGKIERVLERAYAMNADVLPSARAVRPKVDQSDQIREAGGWSAYQKGSAILTMIESWIGEATMQKAIRGYVDASAGRSITSKALFSALDTAAAKPVSKVAASFLDQPGVPLVKVSLSCGAKPNDPAKARLEVSDVSGGGRSWVLPACLRVVGSASPACTLIEGTSATIELPTCAAVHPNFEEAGYYRYELDEAATQRLLASYRKLDERERAGFVLNAWALVLLGRAPPDSVMAALKLGADKAETSRVVLEAVITVLYELERTFATDDNAAKLAAFVRGLLGPHRERVAMPKAGEHDTVRIHRVALLAALYDLGADANVAKALEPIAAQYLASPPSADPDLGPLAVRVSSRAGGVGKAKLDAARLAAAATADERVALVAALASRGDAAALRATLDLFSKGAIQAGDWRHLRGAALRYRDGRAVFLGYIREGFDAMNARLGHAGALLSTIGASCDARELADFERTFRPRVGALEGGQRGLDEGVAEAARCISVRARGAPAFP